MTERLRCCVPYCNRTRPHDPTYSEWICSVHWRSVPQELKARHSYWKRMARKAVMRGRDLPRIFGRSNEAWEACKAVAIEIAMGVM